VFEVGDPARPQPLAEFRPRAAEPGQRDAQLGATLSLTWSYPIVRDGLVYVADINQGLYVLRYRGPHQDELARVAFAEGNSNLFALAPASRGAIQQPAPARSPARAPSARAAGLQQLRSSLAPIGLGLLALAGMTAILHAVLTRRRRRLR
jgi:hypothetical protein